ncbi:Metallo-dependent phosphatase-like protein [Cokeromyces recurvatus]|uniref:Metallo-dependent phosphatase-like protein n=1 Tax=Cokeromyces recurvatus TaxID=90255 RepID=UPI00221E4C30|nr:Metallo-dependent phosphatase-like protein [Cokeromyces recurvatus]KAI7901990.1 Metallo-dependent phosphatase-like protein [Cokeromyces recurvatus]
MDFNEPYSSVSFQYKKLTSPYPYNKMNNKSTPFLSKRQRMIRQLKHHYRSIFFLICFILFIMYHTQGIISNFLTFVKIKMDNTVFDRGYVPCGSLRKQPMLFVQDTQHVQVVWEMNCGMSNKEMTLSYWNRDAPNDNKITMGPIEPKVLDPSHTLYRATIGPIKTGGQIDYILESKERDTQKKKIVARNTFNWFNDIENQPIRIAAMADNQFAMLIFSSLLRQIRKLPKQSRPHLLLHAGDAVQNYHSLRQWQTDFAGPLSMHGLLQTMPMIYAHGNHDYDFRGEYIYTRKPQDNGAPWFAFSMANNAIRFIILDSNLDWELQDQWLKQEIASDDFKEAQFRIVVVHVPPFLEYWDPEAWFQQRQSEWGAFIKDRYVPLFEESHVDLVISGHQHNYERGERNGVHYAIIGGAGGDIDYEQVKDWGMYEAKLLDFHFVMLEFNPPAVKETDSWTLQWDTFNRNGQKVDSKLIFSRFNKDSNSNSIS